MRDPSREVAVDHDPVGALLQRAPLPMREAEPPPLLVVGRHVGDRVRLVLQRVQVRLQLRQRQRRRRRASSSPRRAGCSRRKSRSARRSRSSDVGVADVPLRRDDPVEHLRARRDLMDRQRDVLLEDAQRLSHAVAGDAAADREQLGGEVVHVPARSRRSRRDNSRHRQHSRGHRVSPARRQLVLCPLVVFGPPDVQPVLDDGEARDERAPRRARP